ncbi:MAG: PH domain-containing protein [Streptosporangiaceae bacterium]
MAVRLRPPAHRVARSAVALWAIYGLFGALVLGAIGAGVAFGLDSWQPAWLPGVVAEHVWWAPWIGLVLAAPGLLIEPLWRYTVHRWEVSGDVVYTLSGWFDREWRLVPISRIQTVDTTAGALERTFGLATLRIRTASHVGSSEISGLPAPVARSLAHELAERAGELRDDAT